MLYMETAAEMKEVNEMEKTNPWGVKDDGPATLVPSHKEAVAYLREQLKKAREGRL